MQEDTSEIKARIKAKLKDFIAAEAKLSKATEDHRLSLEKLATSFNANSKQDAQKVKEEAYAKIGQIHVTEMDNGL